MSIPTSGVRSGVPVSPASPGQQVSRETDTALSDATLPVVKNSADSEASSQIKKEWAQRSSPLADNDWDDAGSGELSEELFAESESSPAAQRNARAIPTSSTLTTTSPTFTTITTTTTTAGAGNQAIQPSVAMTAGVPLRQQDAESVSEQPTTLLDLSTTNHPRAAWEIFNFLANPNAQTLRIPLKTPDAFGNVEKFLHFFRQAYALTMPPAKKVIIDACQVNTDPRIFAQMLNEIGRSTLIGGINLEGDAVLKSWVGLKPLLGKNTAIDTLQISGASSDAICDCFKTWSGFQYVPSANAEPGLMIQTLVFSGIQVSDAAVLGAALRTIGKYMRDLQTVDFSGTQLSAQQKNELRAQLEVVGMDILLKF